MILNSSQSLLFGAHKHNRRRVRPRNRHQGDPNTGLQPGTNPTLPSGDRTAFSYNTPTGPNTQFYRAAPALMPSQTYHHQGTSQYNPQSSIKTDSSEKTVFRRHTTSAFIASGQTAHPETIHYSQQSGHKTGPISEQTVLSRHIAPQQKSVQPEQNPPVVDPKTNQVLDPNTHQQFWSNLGTMQKKLPKHKALTELDNDGIWPKQN